MEDYLIKVAELVPENLRNTDVFSNIIDIFTSLVSEDYETAKTIKEALDDLHYYNSDYTKLSYNVKIQKIKDLGFSYLLDVFELSDLELSNLLTFFTVIKAFKCRTEGFRLILDVFKVPYEYHTWDEVEPKEEMFTATLKLNLTPDSGDLTSLAKKLMELARNYTAPLTYVTIDLVEEIGYQNNYFSAGLNRSIIYDTFEITSDYISTTDDFTITIDTRLAKNDDYPNRFYYPIDESGNPYKNAITLDWGDGTSSTIREGDYPYHDYNEAGVYQIKLKLPSENAVTPRLRSSRAKTGVASPSSEKIIALSNPIKNYSGTTLDYAFYRNTNLSSITGDIFKYCNKVTNFSSCFAETAIEQIPAELLSSCLAVESLDDIFLGCTNLTSIPSNLLKNNKALKYVTSMFNGCTGLLEIPETLFSECINIIYFRTVFMNCTSLVAIPEKLFENCTKAAYFESAFSGCINLTGNAPELWLRGGYGTGCFRDCVNLDNYESIPYDWK